MRNVAKLMLLLFAGIFVTVQVFAAACSRGVIETNHSQMYLCLTVVAGNFPVEVVATYKNFQTDKVVNKVTLADCSANPNTSRVCKVPIYKWTKDGETRRNSLSAEIKQKDAPSSAKSCQLNTACMYSYDEYCGPGKLTCTDGTSKHYWPVSLPNMKTVTFR